MKMTDRQHVIAGFIVVILLAIILIIALNESMGV